MDFGALPPEVSSARMYAGSGSGSILAAAEGWDEVAVDLYSAASSFQSVVSGLSVGSWLGTSSGLMAAAASPFVVWLSATAARAEQTANQARAAAAAYEGAFAMTVPPPVILENRTQLTTLIATNLQRQNTPAIAATEAEYGEFWAQDATSMYGYAASAAAATQTLTPFEEAPQISNEGGLVEQAEAVEQAAATAAANQVMNNVPQVLQQLAMPALRGGTFFAQLGELWKSIAPSLGPISAAMSMLTSHAGLLSAGMAMTNTASSLLKGMAPAAAKALEGGVGALENAPKAMGSLGSGLGGSGGSGLAASLGRAPAVGQLSVPSAWVAANQAVMPAVKSLPLTTVAGAAVSAPEHMMGGLPLSQLANAGGGVGGVTSALRMPPRAFVMPPVPAAG